MVDCTGTLGDMLIDGQFFDAVVCTFSEPMGGVVIFGLFVYGAVAGALWLFSGSAVYPLVLSIILGPIVVTQIPGVGLQVVGVFALLLLAGTLYYLVTSRGPAKV